MRPSSRQTTLLDRSALQIFDEPLETLIYGLDVEEHEIDAQVPAEGAGKYLPGVTVKGFFPTPRKTVDQMVDALFAGRTPRASDTLLDPGCGEGAFIGGVLRWCERSSTPVPQIVGVDSDPCRIKAALELYGHHESVRIVQRDFLAYENEHYDFIVGNPPYVPITQLSEREKAAYRPRYRTAKMRFDLYMLFFEEALTHLKEDGRLVFITPEKFIYVDTAAPLRTLLTDMNVQEIRLVTEDTFSDLVTYPTITTVTNVPNEHNTRIVKRDGTAIETGLPIDGRSWLPFINGHVPDVTAHKLEDICVRISCGIATGADAIYVRRNSGLPSGLFPFSYPTIAGRQIDPLSGKMTVTDSMLVPYRKDGRLMNEAELGALGDYLRSPDNRERLRSRTCARRKPWYAFHENPPMADLLRPKILCKDIGEAPAFIIDRTGELIPRHTVYYIIPKDSGQMDTLARYLNSSEAREWLIANCQRAANGFLRIQSQVLKRLPVPPELASDVAYMRPSVRDTLQSHL